MHGTDIRLARLFDDESGRALITAYDHGQSFPLGARSGTPRRTLEQIVAGGPDGVLVTPGILTQHADLFARRGAPSVVLRADWTLLHEPDKHELGERYRVLVEPAEALALADALGLDRAKTLAALEAGAAGSFMLSNRGPRMLQAYAEEGAEVLSRLDIFVKDLGIVGRAARAAGLPAPVAAAAEQLFLLGQAQGLGGADDSAVITVVAPSLRETDGAP